MLESHRSQKAPLNARFRQTSFKDLVFGRGEFLRFFSDQNEFLRLIIIYYTFKYFFEIKTALLESNRNKKNLFKGTI